MVGIVSRVDTRPSRFGICFVVRVRRWLRRLLVSAGSSQFLAHLWNGQIAPHVVTHEEQSEIAWQLICCGGNVQ